MRAAALVGSFTRKEARPGSDVDVVLMTTEPGLYLDGDEWIHELGADGVIRTQCWGVVTERPLARPGGVEVETPWPRRHGRHGATRPGTARVVADGFVPLHDPDGLCAKLIAVTAVQDDAGAAVRLMRALEAQDLEGFLAQLAPDFVLRSPITDRLTFRGHDEMRELMRAHFMVVRNVRYFADVGEGQTRAQFYRASVGGQPVEVATRVELNERGEVAEVTVHFRPLPGLAALAAALGPAVVRSRYGPARATLLRMLAVPLALATRGGDRLVRWFA